MGIWLTSSRATFIFDSRYAHANICSKASQHPAPCRLVVSIPTEHWVGDVYSYSLGKSGFQVFFHLVICEGRMSSRLGAIFHFIDVSPHSNLLYFCNGLFYSYLTTDHEVADSIPCTSTNFKGELAP